MQVYEFNLAAEEEVEAIGLTFRVHLVVVPMVVVVPVVVVALHQVVAV